MTDADVFTLDADQAGDQPHAFIQLDQADRVGMIEGRHFRVMHHHEGIQAALAAGLHGVPVKAVAVDADRCRWMTQGRARGATLDQQLALVAAFPEETGVVTHPGLGSLDRRRCCLLRRRFRLVHVGRAELEDAEQQLPDLLVTARLLAEVAHDQGDKETGAQARGLLVTDRVQARGVVELLARAHIALEGQLGVHRHHRRVTVTLDQLEHLIGVLGGRAGRVVVDVKAFHTPDLQHRWWGDQAVVAAVGSLYRIGVERVVQAHDFAPLANHRRIDFVPGIHATVLAPH
ncbi:hypothetical protein D9M71_327850 [compost metagenome]